MERETLENMKANHVQLKNKLLDTKNKKIESLESDLGDLKMRLRD